MVYLVSVMGVQDSVDYLAINIIPGRPYILRLATANATSAMVCGHNEIGDTCPSTHCCGGGRRRQRCHPKRNEVAAERSEGSVEHSH